MCVSDAFDAYIGYCNNRGWNATLTRKKFGDEIRGAVMRKHGLTVRNDVKPDGRQAQRGWVGLTAITGGGESNQMEFS